MITILASTILDIVTIIAAVSLIIGLAFLIQSISDNE